MDKILPYQSSTLFLGDLSMYCTEKDIYLLFERFGHIESIILKKNNQHCYGFLCFTDPRSADNALRMMNGTILLGRKLRVNWAADYRMLANNPIPVHGNGTNPAIHSNGSAQVHVSFRSSQKLVTEEFLLDIFRRFGEVMEVSIKRSNFHQGNRTFAGFGFVHYPLSPEGITGALEAVRRLNHVQVDKVILNCTLSHGLQEYLQTSPKSPIAVANASSGIFPLPPALPVGMEASSQHRSNSPPMGMNSNSSSFFTGSAGQMHNQLPSSNNNNNSFMLDGGNFMNNKSPSLLNPDFHTSLNAYPIINMDDLNPPHSSSFHQINMSSMNNGLPNFMKSNSPTAAAQNLNNNNLMMFNNQPLGTASQSFYSSNNNQPPIQLTSASLASTPSSTSSVNSIPGEHSGKEMIDPSLQVFF